MNWKIANMDVMDYLAIIPDEEFDGVFCDPPYGISFMGRQWDHGVPSAEVWSEIMRTMKPGSYLLAYGSPRTYHRLACAIEDAGFEIRDCFSWLYGVGFPKNHDISKAIDRKRDDRDEILEVTRWLHSKRVPASDQDFEPVTLAEIDDWFGFNGMASHWFSRNSQPTVPTPEQFATLLNILDVEDVPQRISDLVWKLNERKGQPGDDWFKRPELRVVTKGKGDQVVYDGAWNSEFVETGSYSDDAQQWEGYGTALKPAWEPIVVAMKPSKLTFADNALEHGVSGLNIDAGRIGDDGGTIALNFRENDDSAVYGRGQGKPKNDIGKLEKGRYPANVIIDEWMRGQLYPDAHDKDGNPFFYCAKASTEEREAGLEVVRGTTDDGRKKAADNAYQRGKTKRKNTHPCVKPIDLNRYFCAMMLPPAREESDRRLLVPYAGSGSEMVGALLAGWDRVYGVELDADYCEIAEKRINHHTDPKRQAG